MLASDVIYSPPFNISRCRNSFLLSVCLSRHAKAANVYILHHPAKKGKPRWKWHVHTHLIVMNYDKFFYGKRVFHFVCGMEITHEKSDCLNRR